METFTLKLIGLKSNSISSFEKSPISKWYILQKLPDSTDIEVFKSIPLFPCCFSYSGSELPLYDKRINFLYELLNILDGSDFIGHRCYIKQLIENLKKEREETEKREYLQNFDMT